MGLKGLIVMATMFGSATGLLMFSFVPICIADSDTLQIAVIGPMSGKDHEGRGIGTFYIHHVKQKVKIF